MADPALGLAKTTLKKHFTNKIGEPIKTPFYQSQLEILYENDYFPWIVGHALKELVREGFLKLITQDKIPGFKKLTNIQKISFFVNSKAVETEEEEEKIAKRSYNIAQYVDSYSSQRNSDMLGKHLESLVKAELRAQGFEIEGIHTKKYKDKEWTKSEHNLDFIAKHKDSELVIGVEVKNTLNVMDPKEIDVKIEICKELGITPVFAVRWMKPYMDCIRLQGGFSWVFKTQMYPLGNEIFTKELYQKMSAEEKTNTKGKPLQFPIIVRTELPEKSVNSFVSWVQKVKDNPPQVDTNYRCKDHQRE